VPHRFGGRTACSIYHVFPDPKNDLGQDRPIARAASQNYTGELIAPMSALGQKRTYDDYKKQKDRLAAVSPKTDQVV